MKAISYLEKLDAVADLYDEVMKKEGVSQEWIYAYCLGRIIGVVDMALADDDILLDDFRKISNKKCAIEKRRLEANDESKSI